MKKIVFAFMIAFMFIRSYYCEASTFFNDFDILNGTMNMEYDKYNNEYTVYIEESESRLIFDYELEDSDAAIVISGNDYFVDDNNVVTVTVYSSDDISNRVYTFYVNKYSEDEVSSFNDEMVALEVQKKAFYVESLITMVSFIVVLFNFYYLFLRNKV